jgi:hypothetical protein
MQLGMPELGDRPGPRGQLPEVPPPYHPATLARDDTDASQWHIADCSYAVALGKSAEDLVLDAKVPIAERRFGH